VSGSGGVATARGTRMRNSTLKEAKDARRSEHLSRAQMEWMRTPYLPTCFMTYSVLVVDAEGSTVA